MITLRDYQIEARDAIIGEWRKGVLSTFAMLCTGAGKTEIALSVLASERTEKTRFLGIAHRKELIHQPRDRVIRHWQDQLPIPGVVMADQDDCDAEFVIATVQTLSNKKRLEDLLNNGEFTHVWWDECHHSVSATAQEIIDTIRRRNENVNLLGTTATPLRTDKIALAEVFDSCAYRFSIDKGIRHGALVPFIGYGIKLPVDFSGVEEVGDGWNDEQAGQVLSLANAEEVIIESWKKYAIERKTIAFTASVFQAYSLAQAFRNAGFSAKAVDGTTKKKERDAILESFKKGDIQILVNCAVLTEGFDCPDISCALMAKPTKSDLVYVQCLGRALRLAEGKENCVVLDFAPEGARNMRMAGDILGRKKEEELTEEIDEEEEEGDSCVGVNALGETVRGDPEKVKKEILDYLGTNHFAWFYDGRVSTVSIAPKITIAVIAPQPERIARADNLKSQGKWFANWEDEYKRICCHQIYAIHDNKILEFLGAETDWQMVNYVVLDYSDTHAEVWMVSKSLRWRRKPTGEKQMNLCRKLGVWRDGMKCGEASQAITHALALRLLRSRGIIKTDA